MLLLAILAWFVALTESSVPFYASIIYDEFDLNDNTNIALDVCRRGGCSIFVSTTTWSLDSLRKVYVQTGGANGPKESLYSYAAEADPTTGAKKSFKTTQTMVSIVNDNTKLEPVDPVVIYVIGVQAPNYNSDQVEVYDVANVNMRPTSGKKITLIMSPEPYNLYVDAFGSNLSAILRATGFDNNYQQTSADGCRIVYQQSESKSFRLRVNSPLLSINFGGQVSTQICAAVDYNNVASMDYAGMATSQGYVGCEANKFATYRSSRYLTPQFDFKDSSKMDRQAQMTYAVYTNNTDTVRFTDYTTYDHPTFDVATGTGKTVTKTYTANVFNIQINYYRENNYASSYWLGYTPMNGTVAVASGEGVCTSWPKSSDGATNGKDAEARFHDDNVSRRINDDVYKH